MISTEKYTRKSIRIIENAIKTASEMGHTYVGSEHILLSIVEDGSTKAADILVENGICSSKREAREFVSNNSISINGEKVTLEVKKN